MDGDRARPEATSPDGSARWTHLSDQDGSPFNGKIEGLTVDGKDPGKVYFVIDDDDEDTRPLYLVDAGGAGTPQKLPGPDGKLANPLLQRDRTSIVFLENRKLISIPPGEPVVVAPTPDFYRWSFASMWTPGPFESKPMRAYYYVTDVDRTWSAERQEEHLRDFNYPTLWSISMHEVYPGHFLQYQHLRLPCKT